ncbi:hypothetical protein MKW94_003782, partial [Papaver nudicaule]|nr:hypothetical protein [Papaver nudicaule]
SEGYTTSVAKSTYLSQSASGKCINALDVTVPVPVPVRDSKFTRLHRDAFG